MVKQNILYKYYQLTVELVKLLKIYLNRLYKYYK